MTAKDILSPTLSISATSQQDTSRDISTSASFCTVDADTHIIELISRINDTPAGILAVADGQTTIGYIDRASLLDGLASMVVMRDDSSVITIRCHHRDYSASHIARAVEDADAHLVDLFTSPTQDDDIVVTLRVRHTDPSAVAASLMRHGYDVTSTHSRNCVDAEIAAERLAQLAVFLNV